MPGILVMLEASGSAELSYKQLTSKLNSSQRAQEKVLNAGKRSRHCFILRDWGIHLTSICILPCTKPALRSLAARITHGPCSQSWQGNSTSSSSSCYISAVRKTPCRGGSKLETIRQHRHRTHCGHVQLLRHPRAPGSPGAAACDLGALKLVSF